MWNILKRLYSLFSAKGEKAVSEMEEHNIKALLEKRIRESNESIARAQAGVATAYATASRAEEKLTKANEEEKRLLAQFRALDQAQSPKASDVAGLVKTKRAEIAQLQQQVQISTATAEKTRLALDAARKQQQKNIDEARRNANEIATNRELANALEIANGLVSDTNSNAYELNRLSEMAADANAQQRGRIMAAQGSLEASGLIDDAATQKILNEDAANSLRSELNLAPEKKETTSSSDNTEPTLPTRQM